MKSTSLLLSSEAPCTAPAEQPITYDGKSPASIASAASVNPQNDCGGCGGSNGTINPGEK